MKSSPEGKRRNAEIGMPNEQRVSGISRSLSIAMSIVAIRINTSGSYFNGNRYGNRRNKCFAIYGEGLLSIPGLSL